MTTRAKLTVKRYDKVRRSRFFDKPEEFEMSVDSRSDDVSDPAFIEKRSYLKWGEHCVQCAAPQCHVGCDMYVPRDQAGRCRRFLYGITKTKEFATLQEYTDDIVFLPWSNLLAGITESPAQFDGFLLRVVNPNQESIPFLFYLKDRSGEIRFMVRKIMQPGSNQFLFLVSEIAKYLPADEWWGVFIAPDVNDKTRLFFEFHDFVKFSPQFMADTQLRCVSFEMEEIFCEGNGLENHVDDLVIDRKMLTYLRLFAVKDVLLAALVDGDPERALDFLKARSIHNVLVFDAQADESRLDTLRRLSAHTDLSLQTFAYIDRSQPQRDAAKRMCPQITVLDPDDISLLLFAFYDRKELSEIFERETKLTAAVEERACAEGSFDGPRVDFIRDSRTVVRIQAPRDTHLDRVQDIVQLSNRLNFSNHRYSREEVSKIVSQEERFLSRVVSASDRFGDFGIVGLFIVDTRRTERWLIKDLMLSCAVAGRHLDLFVLRHILRMALDHGAESVDLPLSLSTMNNGAKETVDLCGFRLKDSNRHELRYEFDLLTQPLPEIDYITLETEVELAH